MAKILVLYYSSYGHIEQMADAVAEGARAAGAEVDIRRVAETAPEAVVKAAGFKTDTAHPLLGDPKQLADYDAIVVGSPTRFGRMASQMASFWDTAGGVWAQGLLTGKVGAAFTSTASQHGGQETTLFSILTNLLHFGMTIVGLDYGYAGQMGVDEVKGGAPYGASRAKPIWAVPAIWANGSRNPRRSSRPDPDAPSAEPLSLPRLADDGARAQPGAGLPRRAGRPLAATARDPGRLGASRRTVRRRPGDGHRFVRAADDP